MRGRGKGQVEIDRNNNKNNVLIVNFNENIGKISCLREKGREPLSCLSIQCFSKGKMANCI